MKARHQMVTSQRRNFHKNANIKDGTKAILRIFNIILMSSVNTYKFLFHFVLSLHLINIALQFVFKMSAFVFNTSLKPCTPLANGSIDDQLIKLLPGMNDSLAQFCNVSDLRPVNFILHYPPNLVINRI